MARRADLSRTDAAGYGTREAVGAVGELGVAVWITEAGQPQPMQAVGCKL